MHVRISEQGRRVLNNKALADKVVEAIQANKRRLEKGESVRVSEDGETVSVKFVTTIKADNTKKK